MFTLTDRFTDTLEFENNVLNIDMSFDNIIKLFDLFDDPLFESYEKVDIALSMLIVEYESITDISFIVKLDLYNYILKEFLGFGKGDDSGSSKRVMDFNKDAGLIYASFLTEYRIDLFEQQGKLHWHKFMALLTNLSQDTAFGKVVGYRSMKVPSRKEASEEYRAQIQEMKKAYSLEEEEDIVDNMENKLDAIASSFSRGGE